MIEVALYQSVQHRPGNRAVAWLRVEDDGTWTMRGRSELFDRGLPVRDTHRGRWVSFDDDPQVWARYLWTRLRTGYLVPVAVEDTDPDPPPRQRPPLRLAEVDAHTAARAAEGTSNAGPR